MEIVMGMRISGSAGMSQASSVANWQQRQQTFQQLTSALQAGDLGAAQQAFASLTGGNSVQGNGPLAQLGQALKNGDLASAQKAMQALQSNHSKHHHHAGQTSAAQSTTQSPLSTSGTGQLINVTA